MLRTLLSLDPPLPVRGDFQSALVASTLANVFRGKGQKAIELEEFLLDFERGPRERNDPDNWRKVKQQIVGIFKRVGAGSRS